MSYVILISPIYGMPYKIHLSIHESTYIRYSILNKIKMIMTVFLLVKHFFERYL